jgi:dihydrofolate reductase
MRTLRYNVAVSLDGFIADPGGGYDWIIMDKSIDFAALFSEFDTLLMGRKTYEVLRAQEAGGPESGKKIVVVSRTLTPEDHPGVIVIADHIVEEVTALKRSAGGDIWLFGGGQLFRLLLDAGLVDRIELAVMPVMLGSGIPVLPPGARSPELRLLASRQLPSSILMLTYETKKRA